MSSVWNRPSSWDVSWDNGDSLGVEKGDFDGWDNTVQGMPCTGNNESMDTRSSGHDAQHTTTPDESGDFACRVCGETGHFARQCPNLQTQACYNCGEEGHTKADCPNRRKVQSCFNCGDEGHSKADCPNPHKPMGECYNCGQEGHSKADCPNPRKPMGACFNCGQDGHSKADCPNPSVFKGACRICSQEGHPASACPERPVDICKNCRGEGHIARDCKENRKFDLNHVADRLPEEAWGMMKKASDEKDIVDFREAVQVYSKAVPDATYAEIEKKMRGETFKVFLIALEKEREDVLSLIDLQGQLDREYLVGFFFSDKPMRANQEQRWPRDSDENLERLANAGLPYDRQVTKCWNCGEMGHSARACKQDRAEVEKTEIKCNNCESIGHRVRDCKEKRRSKYGCRNCGVEGHEARDCPESPAATDIECRRCNEVGHFAKDCPNQPERVPRTCRNCGSEDHLARECDQPRNPDMMICRNCEKSGHAARDCPEPKDWSKVKCNQCGEMGHTVRRCPQPEALNVPEENEAIGDGGDEPDYGRGRSGQADYDHGGEVENVRQQMEDVAW
ncbi:uncharacterized protein N7482_003733 [Penicillium canariense]|uniref:CCHC-type domain-containing protein n=1 Tax=Penicillium canariense TaxID=189055 RepID=A0A9W9I7L1_9EURO|nr:uncharacterized protein N7482_003733 [Penicillium canariense]KAJ5168139.1 hypothetical protein N7482_003733 [Penicillium canariense]